MKIYNVIKSEPFEILLYFERLTIHIILIYFFLNFIDVYAYIQNLIKQLMIVL